MSKESSIKVFAENASGTRPANAIPVWIDNISAIGAGSTVASSDVFPPTNNLDPYATYYLGWNANNGGLFWYNPGNGGN